MSYLVGVSTLLETLSRSSDQLQSFHHNGSLLIMLDTSSSSSWSVTPLCSIFHQLLLCNWFITYVKFAHCFGSQTWH